MTQDEAEAWVELHMQAPYARDLFPLELVAVTPGAVTLALAHRPAYQHAPGFFQGAITTAVGEYAASYAAATGSQPDWRHITLEQSVHFLGAARGERLVAEARTIAPGRNISVARAEIFIEAAGVRSACATLTLTMRHSPLRD